MSQASFFDSRSFDVADMPRRVSQRTWRIEAEEAVVTLAKRLPEFTTDEVWDLIEAAPPSEPRALGHVMTAMAARGWIRATDRVRKSRRPECHSRPVQIWESLPREER